MKRNDTPCLARVSVKLGTALFLLVLSVGSMTLGMRTAGAAQAASSPKAGGAQKPIKKQFVVLHMMRNAIQVRGATDEREIHTFTYSDQIREKMQNLSDKGGFQFGDKVRIQFVPGEEVAQKISGRPSKAI